MSVIVCLGDSNTYGFDPRSFFGGRYPEEVRWTGILKQKGYDIRNYGQNGLSIPDNRMQENLIRLPERENADLVTVMLGSNDLLGGSSAETAAARMENLIQALRKSSCGFEVILIAPPVMKKGDWVEHEEMIRESVLLIPAYEALAQKTGIRFADSSKFGVDLAYDGVHFTPEGHRAFARGIEPFLKKAKES